MTRRTLAIALLLATTGCATGRSALSTDPGADAAHLSNVPFFPDASNQCGPATLAALLTFWGHPETPQSLRPELYLPAVGGTLPMDMLPAVQARGLNGTVSFGTVDDIKTEIRAGRPVLAFVDYGVGPTRFGHFVVVTGFDARGLRVNSARKRDVLVSYRKWDPLWERTDRWMLVIDGPKKA